MKCRVVTLGKWGAFVATINIWVAAILRVLSAFGILGSPYPRGAHGQRLELTHVSALWEYRRSHFYIDVAVDLLMADAFMFLMPTIVALAEVLRKQGLKHFRARRNLMAAMFALSAVVPFIAVLGNIGVTSVADRYSNMITKNGTVAPSNDLIALEMAYGMIESGLTWVNSTIFLTSSMGFLLCAWTALKTPGTLGKGHSILGIIIGFIGFILFILELVSLVFHEARVGLGLGFLLWGLILVPIWMLSLGVQIGRIDRARPLESAEENLELVNARRARREDQIEDEDAI